MKSVILVAYCIRLSPVCRHFPLLVISGHARMTDFVVPPFFKSEEALYFIEIP